MNELVYVKDKIVELDSTSEVTVIGLLCPVALSFLRDGQFLIFTTVLDFQTHLLFP